MGIFLIIRRCGDRKRARFSEDLLCTERKNVGSIFDDAVRDVVSKIRISVIFGRISFTMAVARGAHAISDKELKAFYDKRRKYRESSGGKDE